MENPWKWCQIFRSIKASSIVISNPRWRGWRPGGASGFASTCAVNWQTSRKPETMCQCNSVSPEWHTALRVISWSCARPVQMQRHFFIFVAKHLLCIVRNDHFRDIFLPVTPRSDNRPTFISSFGSLERVAASISQLSSRWLFKVEEVSVWPQKSGGHAFGRF